MRLTGAEILWDCLVREGVTDVFGYPGGAILPAYDAMLKYPIRHVLVRHEQGATHMADGYARASGRVGWPNRGMPCCSVRRVPASTCTGVMPSGATIFSASSAGSLPENRPANEIRDCGVDGKIAETSWVALTGGRTPVRGRHPRPKSPVSRAPS
jgi:hypothetical protein